MVQLNHIHMLGKAFLRNPPRKPDEMEQWLKQLVIEIDMKELFPPRAIRMDEEGNTGVTGDVVLTTSHATYHTFGDVGLTTSHATCHIFEEEDFSVAQFDVYSCQEFDAEIVVDHFKQFDLYEIDYTLIDRNGKKARIMEQVSHSY